VKRWLQWILIGGAVGLVTGAVTLKVLTESAVLPLPAALEPASIGEPRPRFVDRNGVPLNATYTGEWNVDDQLPLHEIPPFLREAFINAEDKRFRSHHGADWKARFAAAADNLRNLDTIRGASTISEQTVRMLHPRPRSFWSRWLAGVEAGRLEERFSKDEILGFYLNQVPYASNRRGVRQAAELYFGRDLNTLSDREMLLLAVLVRAPSALDPRRNPAASVAAIGRLNDTLLERGVIDEARHRAIAADSIVLQSAELNVTAPHFLAYAASQAAAQAGARPPQARALITTLDASLQAAAQKLLDTRMAALASHEVHDGAVLVVDNATCWPGWSPAAAAPTARPRISIRS
jgi:penicillin-binding protein 1C